MRRVVGLLLVSALWACGGDGGGVTPPGAEGSIQGQVTGPGGGVPGAQVTLAGGGTMETGSDGTFRFDDVGTGNHSLSVSPPSGFALAASETGTKSVEVAANTTASVSWSVRLADATPVAVEVGLTASSFDDDDVTMPVGSTVTWVNRTAITHTITPDQALPGGWTDITIQGEGTEFEHTFGTAGTFEYVCRLHAGMTGVVRVH